jgi:hypothetical protein
MSHSPLFQWGDSGSPSVFYQTSDNSLHEMKYDGRDWNDTAFVQPDAMPGTAMAEVGATARHHKPDNYCQVQSMLFFQDTVGFLCYWYGFVLFSPHLDQYLPQGFHRLNLGACCPYLPSGNHYPHHSNHLVARRRYPLGDLKIPGLCSSSMTAISGPGPQIQYFSAPATSDALQAVHF